MRKRIRNSIDVFKFRPCVLSAHNFSSVGNIQCFQNRGELLSKNSLCVFDMVISAAL